MLLGQLVLIGPGPRARVTAVWRVRERTEREAQALFATLADQLAGEDGAGELAAMARQAARDEERHALRCGALVARFGGGPPVPPLRPRALRLGAAGLTRQQRTLFASVALSCVTETLSTALLLELRAVAVDPLVRTTLNEILRDEVDHARLGWAHLAAAARHGSVAWLGAYVPQMVEFAVPSSSGASGAGEGHDLTGYGVLPRAKVPEVVRAVWRDVLAPGLERFGVAPHPDPLAAWRGEGNSCVAPI